LLAERQSEPAPVAPVQTIESTVPLTDNFLQGVVEAMPVLAVGVDRHEIVATVKSQRAACSL